MPKYEDNRPVMNPNLVYFSLMGYLISLYRSFQTACVGVFNSGYIEMNKTF